MNHSDLTPKQKDIYLLILDFIEQHGFPPTIREMQAVFKLSSPNGVVCHLEALARKGWIEWGNDKSRSIKTLKDPIRIERNTDIAKNAKSQLGNDFQEIKDPV